MSDLLEQLGGKINETERIALAALSHPGNYDHEAKGWIRTGTDDGVWSTGGGYSDNPCRVGGMGITIYDEGGHDEHQAVHIAHNDPKRVLRRVARDRKLLERHFLIHRDVGWVGWIGDGGERTAVLPVCGHCVPDEFPWFKSRSDVPVYPCADVRDLAEDYGINVES